AKLLGERPAGTLPVLDFEAAREAHAAVRRGVVSGALASAHDIAEGGIAVALAECCVAGEVGATVSLPERLNEFAEAPGRAFIVSGSAEALDGFAVIGRVGGDSLELEGTLEVPVSDLREAFEHGLTGFV
ncbi:MAG TPA: AIR synthase-related protein, partial [Solirubrobacteraceae bacterium]